jgi:Rod binding domain-containing protein
MEAATLAPLAPSSRPVAATAGAPPVPEAARKTAEDFEAYFLTQSLESMYAGIGSDDLFGGGSAELVYRSLLMQQYGKVAAGHGGIGIANAVLREIVHSQEVQ